jgi:hypothetical protein
MPVTVSCADGDIGHVFKGTLPFDVERISLRRRRGGRSGLRRAAGGHRFGARDSIERQLEPMVKIVETQHIYDLEMGSK